MSSDEDFTVVSDLDPSEMTLEEVKASIVKYQKRYDEVVEEQKEQRSLKEECQELTKECKLRTVKLTKELEKDERLYKDQLAKEQAKLDRLKQEESDLMETIQEIKSAIQEEETNNAGLKEQADVFCAMPEKRFVFKGMTGKAGDQQKFDMKSHITYPMEGGTALITFEEKDVASNILEMKRHRVDLGGECRIIVEAKPVHLMVPRLVEIDSEVCPQRILVSNLPKMEIETLLNKLEIHFSKSKNGGGEVDSCDFLLDSGTVVITFVQDNIARRLTEMEYHEVKLTQRKHKVRVTPFLNGKITNLEPKMLMCSQTVLLTGIPDIMEPETLQDLLEIHFQKNANGGGEIEAFLYNPLGQNFVALFGNASSEE